MEAHNKTCGKRKEIKSLDLFYNDKNSKDGKGPTCKSCRKIELRRYYSKPEVKEKVQKYNLEYKINNKDKHDSYYKNYKRNRYHNERCKYHSKMAKTLFERKTELDEQIEFLGCSTNEFRKHIFNKLQNPMSIENHGEIWELDHIIPVKAFDIFDFNEVKRAFHYTNIQPLLRKEHESKGDKMPNGELARNLQIRQQDDIWLAYNSI